MASLIDHNGVALVLKMTIQEPRKEVEHQLHPLPNVESIFAMEARRINLTMSKQLRHRHSLNTSPPNMIS